MTRIPPTPREIWQEFHWAFFVDVQGLILCMRRLALMLDQHDLKGAEQELHSATVLMRASASAMVLAGSFPKADYENTIRPSMTQPNVASDNFSGLMSWEHGVLVNLWRELTPRFATLPDALHDAHREFANAYGDMAEGHVHVCAKFVGRDGSSLRFGDREALKSLENFGRTRRAAIDPEKRPARCPVVP